MSGRPRGVGGPIGVALLSALMSGCAVGPRYVRPEVSVPAAYKEAPAGSDVMEPAQPNDAAPRQAWWEVFGDERLSDLQSRLLASNPTLAQAEARFRQARALVAQDRAAYWPTATTSTSVDRNQAPVRGSNIPITSAPFTQYALTGNFSWEADFWGRIRHTVAAGVASQQAAVGDVETSRLSLTAELALDYFQLRSLDADQALLRETIAADEKALALTENQYNAGFVSRADVAQAQTELESARAQAMESELQRVQMEHAIGVLTGAAPSELTLAPVPLAGDPPSVPVEMPSRLLERRADIAGAERRMAAANAQIGVATAAFFPSIMLGGSGGFQATALEQWLTWPSRFWSIGPALALTVFDGGARRAVREGATAAYDEAVGVYRQTVLTAFQDVEDNLAAARLLAEESRRQEAAVVAARQSLEVSLNQYRAGLVSYLPVATAQGTALTNERTLVALAARRYAAAVQLIKALGGGWNGSLDASNASSPTLQGRR